MTDENTTSEQTIETLNLHKTCPMQTKSKGKPCLHYIDAYNEGEAGFCDSEKRYRCIEALKHSQPALSHTAALAWVKCKMYFYYHYILGIRTKTEYLSDGIKRGNVWDTFMNGKDYKVVADEMGISNKDRVAISALIDAYNDLEIVKPEGIPQGKLSYPYNNNTVVCFVDWLMEDGFEEWKLSASPGWYLKTENIFHQVGTYFMASDRLEYVDMKPAQMPQLKTGGQRTKYVNETDNEFYDRIYSDILARPSFYFVGYNRDTKTWGKRFFRKEFDLGYMEFMYKWLFTELRETMDRGSWYKNEGACHNPFECDFFDICRTGVVSSNHYYFVHRTMHKKGEEVEEINITVD